MDMLRRLNGWCSLAIAAVVVAGCGQDEQVRPQVQPPQVVTFATDDGASIAGTWWAVERSRSAVLLIPTAGYTRGTWETTAGLLTADGRCVMTIDLRGQGESEPPAGTDMMVVRADSAQAVANYMKDVLAAIKFIRQQMQNGGSIVLVGSDLGGVAALYAAAVTPEVNGVSLFSPPGGLAKIMAQGLVSRYGDRPLLIMTELPLEATLHTARTLDSWLGRGSALKLRLSAQEAPVRIDSRPAAVSTLKRWVASTAH